MHYDHKRKKRNLKITFSEKQLSATLKEVKKINKKIDSLFEELKDIKNDFGILVKREYDNFISILMKYSSKTPMLESEKQLDFKVIKNVIRQQQRIGNYYQTLTYINLKQIHNILKKCTQGKTEGDFELEFNPKSFSKKIPICSFLYKKTAKVLLYVDKKQINI